MRYSKRAPIDPPKDFARSLQRALRDQEILKVDGISIYPPSKSCTYWRLKYTFNGKSTDLKGGKEFSTVYAAFLELAKVRDSRHAISYGLPKESFAQLSEALEIYIQQGGIENRWKNRTKIDRGRDFGPLLKRSKKLNLSCKDLDLEDVREFINSAGTQKSGKHLIGITRTFMLWGLRTGYFSEMQAGLVNRIQWSPPKGVDYESQPSRRQQSQIKYAHEGSMGGQVMTPNQVTDFANSLQKFYAHGEGLVNTLANLGTRANETFLLTASEEIAKSSRGNLIDLETMSAHIYYQVNDDPSRNFKSTKNGKPRRVVIPNHAMTANGFDIQHWLSKRVEDALFEQANGLNPLALIFPNSIGEVLDLKNFNKRSVRPATNLLGWRMDTYMTAKGNARALSRFTLHSLRAYYGTIAADVWRYTERQLLEQGSWADPQTVRRFYQGTSDDTFDSVRKVHEFRGGEM